MKNLLLILTCVLLVGCSQETEVQKNPCYDFDYREVYENFKDPSIHPCLKYQVTDWEEFKETAEKAMKEQDPNILECVLNINYASYGRGYGDHGVYSSYEYCQWMKEQ